MSLGGEIRERYEYTHNPGFGAEPQDTDGVWLQRVAVHGDLQWGQHARIFAELHSALEHGRAGGPSPVDENEAELQNAFVELELPPTDGGVLLRIGRQEMQFGSARLVSVRDGPNVRRTFDGGRIMARSGPWRLDALAVRPRKDRTGAFDDSTDDSKALWGIYATRALEWPAPSGADLYYLGYRNDNAVFDQGSGPETRHTLGARLFGNYRGWSWNWEAMIQFGRFGGADLRAWTIASETGYTWSNARLRPRLMLSANIASGDRDPQDPDLQTFNPLFPRGNYFSEDSILGPQNFYNAHLFLTVHPSRQLALTADYDFFWRLSRRDGVYGPNGQLVRSGDGSDARFVATAVSLTSEWEIDRNWTLTAIYTHFHPEKFLEETGPSESVDFLELTARFRF